MELERDIQPRQDLQKEYDELQRAHSLNQERFIAELQAEREKSRMIQRELEALKCSHHHISQKYDSDVVSLRQRAETLLGKIDMETKAHAATVENGWQVVNTLKAELEELKTQL